MTNIKNFGFWSTQKTIQEAMNVVRWKPCLAILWMDEVQSKIDTFVVAKLWNKAVDVINKEIEDQQKYSFYDAKEAWEGMTPRKLSYVEELISLEEYARMSQIEGKK